MREIFRQEFFVSSRKFLFNNLKEWHVFDQVEEQAKETGKIDPEFGLDTSGIAGTAKIKKEEEETKMEEGESEMNDESSKDSKQAVSSIYMCIAGCTDILAVVLTG